MKQTYTGGIVIGSFSTQHPPLKIIKTAFPVGVVYYHGLNTPQIPGKSLEVFVNNIWFLYDIHHNLTS
jgi:hypothetical protein